MERVRIVENLDFSRIIYGMWRLTDDSDTSVAHCTKKISLCLDQGITTFDQADIYGDYKAEEVLGNVLAADKSIRNKIEIITKCDIIAPCGKFEKETVKHYDTSAKHIKESVDSSLKNMNIDHIDMLLLHRPDPLIDPDETGSVLDELIESGKIKTAGVSNFKPWDWSLLESHMKNSLRANQIEFSLIQTEALTNGDLSFHYQHKTPMMAWSPLGGGKLFNRVGKLAECLSSIAKKYNADVATVAIAWILNHPAGILPIVGTNNLSRISKISKALNIAMDRRTWFELYTASIGNEVP